MQKLSRDERVEQVKSLRSNSSLLVLEELIVEDIESLRDQLEKSGDIQDVKFIQGMIKQAKKILTILK